MNSAISSSLITIFERSFFPTRSFQAAAADQHREAVDCAVAGRLVDEGRRDRISCSRPELGELVLRGVLA